MHTAGLLPGSLVAREGWLLGREEYRTGSLHPFMVPWFVRLPDFDAAVVRTRCQPLACGIKRPSVRSAGCGRVHG
jgi:hypothetical protein